MLFANCSKDNAGDDTGGTTNPDVTLSHKYEVEKGIITFESYNDLMDETNVYKVFFTDYGAREVKYEYSPEGVLEEITMQKGDGWFYQVSIKYGGATKSKSTYATGTEMQFTTDWSASQIEEYNYKLLNDTTVCGRSCKMYSYETSSTLSAIAAGYKGITLYFKVMSRSQFSFDVINRAVSFQENAAVNDTVWKLPANITITED
jgi:hypothetical protein